MKILLLSAYDTASHKYWRQGLVANFPEHQWTVLTLPARYFAWRLRGNSLTWAYTQQTILQADYDLLIATSMTDLSALRGMQAKLSAIPTLVYFHENQFAYPLSAEQKHAQIFNQSLNLYTALCADQIAFNSDYNRNTFLNGAEQFLKQMPDHVPANLLEELRQKSILLPVPLNDECFASRPVMDDCSENVLWKRNKRTEQTNNQVKIVWAARWEYDKGPDRLLAILRELESRGTNYRLCILGQQFRTVPTEFEHIRSDFTQRIDQIGYLDSKAEYVAWLSGADIILATATHEFQGLSVIEAVAAGCIPVLPDRLAYAELFESGYKYPDCGGDIGQEAQGAVDLIEHQARLVMAGESSVPGVEHLGWAQMKRGYGEVMMGVVGRL